jgi:hypothetical protein
MSRSVMIHFRATEAENAEWTAAAGRRGLSRWIRDACQAHLDQQATPVMTFHAAPKPGACARHGLVDCGICEAA